MGEDWLDQLIQESGSWAEPTFQNPDGTWGNNPGNMSFQNPDGSWGSTAANSGPEGWGGPGTSTLGALYPEGSQGLLDYAKKYGLDALKALGLGSDAISAIARAVPGIAGAISSAGQSGKLSDLSNMQRTSEAARYADQVAREQARYTTEAARQDAARKENIALERERYGQEVARQDEGIARQAGDIAYDKGVVAPSQARYEGSFAPGFTMANDPGYTDALDASSKATLHSLSVGGNPAGSPNAWATSLSDNFNKTAYPALQKYREQNAATGFGGPYAAGASTVRAIPQTITGNITQSIPASLGDPYAGNTLSTDPGGQASLASITQSGQTAANLGGAVNDVFNPKSPLEDLVKRVKDSGLNDIFRVGRG